MAAVHRTILVVDVERFGSPIRTDHDRVMVGNSALATGKQTG
jgi:hypothetical protein